MKVLFIYTDINIRGGEMSYSLGLGILSALLKQHGHTVKLCHMYDKYNPALMHEKIKSYKPDILAFSSISPQWKFIKGLINEAKPYNIFTICGGPHTTLNPQCLEEVDGLSAICRGEGEYPLLELVENLKDNKAITQIKSLWIKQDGKIYENPCRPFIKDLDTIPFADRELYDYGKIIKSNYDRADFMFSRGCPFDCTYCSNHKIRHLQDGQYVRFRSVDNVIREIKDVVSRYNIRVIFMQDDTFTMKKDWVYEFCKKYKKEIGIPFMMHTRPEVVTKEMFDKLKDAGCFRVAMGLESGNNYIRTEILNRKITDEQLKFAFKTVKEAGLVTKSFNIVGFPHETKEYFQDTIKLNAEIMPDLFTLTIFDPYPGTKLYDICKEKGYLTNRGEQEGFIPRTDTILNLPLFPRKEILKCYRNFGFNIYKNHSLLKALVFRIYYSSYGETLIRLFTPFKKKIFSIAEMKLKKKKSI